MAKKQNIFIIGPMGAGKTTIGRQLAQELKLDFYDSDQEIEARTGADIPWIFDIEGEAGFRQREAKTIVELAKLSGIVLATGGGVVMDPNNRAALASHGVVIYLSASVEHQLERTLRSQNRPLILDTNRKQALEELYKKREPLYRELADYIYDTDQLGLRAIVSNIIKDLARKFHTPG